MTVELPREDMELVLKALELVGGSLPEDPTRSLFAAGADALVHMAREALGGGGESDRNQDNYQVVVHVDASALQGEGGEADLPLTTIRRLCCDGGVVPLVERGDGKPLNVGRKQRTVPTSIKRALLARDRRCTYPVRSPSLVVIMSDLLTPITSFIGARGVRRVSITSPSFALIIIGFCTRGDIRFSGIATVATTLRDPTDARWKPEARLRDTTFKNR